MSNNNTFLHQLKIGNKKEHYVCNLLNICGVKTEPNNEEEVTDIDLILPEVKIIMDVKFINTAFNNSKQMVGIEPQDCLPINVRHVHNYYKRQEETKCQAWVCFLIKLDDYNINELKFVPVDYLEHLIWSGKGSIRNGKLNFNRNDCKDMTFFLNYCSTRLTYKQKKYNFK